MYMEFIAAISSITDKAELLVSCMNGWLAIMISFPSHHGLCMPLPPKLGHLYSFVYSIVVMA